MIPYSRWRRTLLTLASGEEGPLVEILVVIALVYIDRGVVV